MCKLYGWAIFYNEESSITCTTQPSGGVFRDSPERQGKYLSIKRWVITQKNSELWQKFFSVEVYQTFLKLHAKNLLKVTRIGGKLWAKRDRLI